MFSDLYTTGEYVKNNPDWHVLESPWKTEEIVRMLTRHKLTPHSICEVGCGAGEILHLLQQQMSDDCIFTGYEISPYAFELCQARANDRLQFKLGDIQDDVGVAFDLILVMDVLEHMEDYFSLLRNIRPKSEYKLFHFPLDLSVRAILRQHLVEYRERFGHIHYFTKELAIRVLQDAGYTVLDSFYTREPSSFPPDDRSATRVALLRSHLGQSLWKLRKMPAKLWYTFNQDLAVRTFGDWRLLVLAQ
jgi:SAM-dependent methyltransferase